eukprot:CAMPEP_0176372350 /NCGR_PEP_ID=MMETSP0126-20121128/25329_1 /TAXON_ID=141414 ORGANISM="Strombidinopsis acuminatum, Strain SPMC142" /NCGR_SAMPLE_ID=MMETSP0126 /ASSEMBLY_ACC=CAM_ASM_000229 /LENGTH=161 /DNA_ID=CAMNT_0017732157 /DNA_START=628 /DNA_END=1113 /DNA_ORIENTATION=-
MTSVLNHKETKDFFKSKKYFGAAESNVIFVKQEMFGQVNVSGKLQMATRTSLAMNPNGSGGIFSALKKNAALINVISSVEQVHLIDVLNVESKVFDPQAIGFSKENDTYVVAQGVKREGSEDAKEAVNVFVINNQGKKHFEVANIQKDEREAKNEDGSLKH